MASARKNAEVSDMIDENLKEIFQEELDKELPDRFMNLISQLRDKDQKHQDTGPSA